MEQPHDDFWPQTLSEQLRGIWRRSGAGNHLRLMYAVLGWVTLSMLVSAAVLAWLWGSASGRFSSMAIGVPMWLVSLMYVIQDALIWLGSIHLVLWSQWRWPTRPSTRKLVLLALGMSVISVLLRHPPVSAAYRSDFLLFTWLQYVIFFVWYVLLIRSAATCIRFQFVTRDAVSSDPAAARSWSLRGLFLATLLVAITIVVKRWMHALQDDFSQPFSGGQFAWVEMLTQSYSLLSTLALVYAAAMIFVGRGVVVPAILIAVTVLLAIAVSVSNILLLPASVVQTDWTRILPFWALRVAAVICLHLIAFRVWRWAGYSLRIADETKGVVADRTSAESVGSGF